MPKGIRRHRLGIRWTEPAHYLRFLAIVEAFRQRKVVIDLAEPNAY